MNRGSFLVTLHCCSFFDFVQALLQFPSLLSLVHSLCHLSACRLLTNTLAA
eukprot:m.327296 g.327296  ORF g.327296 m.327296 type:complete len:51 (-) comp16491_c0_seq10:636-788(-)